MKGACDGFKVGHRVRFLNHPHSRGTLSKKASQTPPKKRPLRMDELPHHLRHPGVIRFPCKIPNLWLQPWFHKTRRSAHPQQELQPPSLKLSKLVPFPGSLQFFSSPPLPPRSGPTGVSFCHLGQMLEFLVVKASFFNWGCQF